MTAHPKEAVGAAYSIESMRYAQAMTWKAIENLSQRIISYANIAEIDVSLVIQRQRQRLRLRQHLHHHVRRRHRQRRHRLSLPHREDLGVETERRANHQNPWAG